MAADPALVLHEGGRSPPSLLAWPPAEFSLSHGVESNVMPCIERMLSARTKLRRGQALYQSGGRFHALYALRTGTCKSVIITRDGHDQIIGYHIVGEIVGADGIATDAHECEATALEDMDVCPLPFDQIDDIARISDQFRRNFVKLLSRETARARSMMIMLGTMCADQRLAAFLLDLSQRYGARGYSTHEFVLRMTRSEIGSYLGLKLETVEPAFLALSAVGPDRGPRARGDAARLPRTERQGGIRYSRRPGPASRFRIPPDGRGRQGVRDLGNSRSVSRRTTP